MIVQSKIPLFDRKDDTFFRCNACGHLVRNHRLLPGFPARLEARGACRLELCNCPKYEPEVEQPQERIV